MDELISESDFEGNNQAILEFVCIDTDITEFKDRVYLTSVDEISSEPHGQKISLILGPHTGTISINAINYVQVKYSLDRLDNVLDRYLPKLWKLRSRKMRFLNMHLPLKNRKLRMRVSSVNMYD